MTILHMREKIHSGSHPWLKSREEESTIDSGKQESA